MSEELSGAIAALKRRALEHVAALKSQPDMVELLKLHSALNALEGICIFPPTSVSALFGLDTSAGVQEMSRPFVSPGEFLGMPPLTAAKLYLKKRDKKPASFAEILEGLEAGSCEVSNKEKLRVYLGRSTFEIAKLNDDSFGLLEWYPNEKEKRAWGGKKRASNNQQTDDTLDTGTGGIPTLGPNE